jgi:Uroporphyrinogen decarboxylase (URO-D)
MNNRQRFLETMRFGKPDRLLLFEEGMRSQVLRSWRKQGLRDKQELAQLFHYDAYEEFSPDLEPHLDLLGMATTRSALDQLQRSLDPNDPRRLPRDWKKRIKSWQQREHVLILQVHEGFFLTLGVGDWRSFSQAVYLTADQPEFVRQVFRIQGEFAARIAERILDEVQVDAILYSEPIAGSHGPLISPRMYAELVLASLPPLMEVLERHGVEVVIYRTYANPRRLLEQVFQAGFNCLWACERQSQAMDYLDLRSQLGSDLRLIGGIDLDVLRQEPAAIQKELERTVRPLLSQGGYLPLADGRVRENIPFANYSFYRHYLEQIAQSMP